jgi:hypothetical protein
MKKCKSCGIEYSDLENFCIQCGKRLEKVRATEMPPAEFMSLVAHVGELETAIEGLRNKVEGVRHPKIPDDIVEISKNIKRIRKLADDIQVMRAEAKSMMSEVNKQISKMPDLGKDDLVTLVAQVGELQTGVDKLKNRVEEDRYPELPEDIVDISKNKKEIIRLSNDIQEISMKALQDARATSKKLSSEMRQLSKESAANASNLSKKMTAQLSDINKKLSATAVLAKGGAATAKVADTATKSNKKLTLEEIKKIKTLIKNIEDRVDSRLDGFGNELRSLTKAQEKLELEKILPESKMAKKIDEMLMQRASQLKREITRELLREIQKELVG